MLYVIPNRRIDKKCKYKLASYNIKGPIKTTWLQTRMIDEIVDTKEIQ